MKRPSHTAEHARTAETPAAVERHADRAFSLCLVLVARVAELESSNVELRATLGLDVLAPAAPVIAPPRDQFKLSAHLCALGESSGKELRVALHQFHGGN